MRRRAGKGESGGRRSQIFWLQNPAAQLPLLSFSFSMIAFGAQLSPLPSLSPYLLLEGLGAQCEKDMCCLRCCRR